MTKKVVLYRTTGAQSIALPSDFGAPYTLHVIGAGGNGRGSGGFYAAVTDADIVLAASQSLYAHVGVADGSNGVSNDTWFNKGTNAAPTSTALGALARGGMSAYSGSTRSGSVGSVIHAGGVPSDTSANTNGGGGGAGGPNGVGGNGGLDGGSSAMGAGGGGAPDGGTNGATATSSVGGAGGTPNGGKGADYSGSSATVAGAGTTKALWTQTSDGATAGPGGGGGGGNPYFNFRGVGDYRTKGGNGGAYGGGGGGGPIPNFGGLSSYDGIGGQGLIVLEYTPPGVTMPAATGSLSLVGNAATLWITPKTIAAATGALTLAGNPATLTMKAVLSAAAGALTLAGQDVSFYGLFSMAAAPGALTINGQTARLAFTNNASVPSTGWALGFGAVGEDAFGAGGEALLALAAEAGALTLTGNAATMFAKFSMPAAAGALSLAGNAATLTITRYSLQAAAGALTLTGNAVTLATPRSIVAETGALTLAGGDAAFSIPGLFVLAGGVGTLSLAGQAATLNYSTRVLSAAAGTLTLAGNAVTFYGNFPMQAAAGALTLAGPGALLVMNNPSVSDTLTDGIGFTSAPTHAFGMSLADGLGVTPSQALAYRAGAAVVEALALQHVQIASGVFSLTTTESLALLELLTRGMPVDLADRVGVHDVLALAQGAQLLEQLLVGDNHAPSAAYGVTLLHTLAISPSLRFFVGGDLTDTLGVAPILSAAARWGALLQETLGVELVSTPTLLLNVTLADTIALEPEQLLQMIFDGQLSDGFQVTAAYLAPGGNFVTWALNTRTTAVTEYENFTFNSFARMGRAYLAGSDQGLFELTGDTDAGADIIAHIQSGFAQFNGSKLNGFKAAYLGVRGEGDFILRLVTGDGKTYDYGVRAHDMATTKVNMGKGLRARYFAFELTSAGQDFELDNIEFMPMTMSRRV